MSACFFDSFAIEIYNGSWTDVTADVLTNPSPKWNRGIMSNNIDEHVGNAGNFTFSLNNSTSNSAGVAGYYSPDHASCWSGWKTGLAVRLSFTFEGQKYYKYYGTIKPDGIDVETGIYGTRRVNVTCGDWMWKAGNYHMKETTYQANKRVDELITSVNTNMPTAPLATDYDTGVETFPSIFDNTTVRSTALSEYTKGAMSEWADIYVRGDMTGGETLVVDNKMARSNKAVNVLPMASAEISDVLLLETEDHLLLEDGAKKLLLGESQSASFTGTTIQDMRVEYGKNLYNKVSVSAYPRKIDADATNVLFKTERRIKLNPSETMTNYQTAYNDPNQPSVRVSAIALTTPVSGTDYTATANEDGTGANMIANLTVTVTTFAEASYWNLTNTNTTTAMWVYLQVRGQGAYLYDPITRVRNDTTSQSTHGVIPLDVDMKYHTDANKAAALSEYLLTLSKDPYTTIESCTMWANKSGMNMFGFLQLEPGEKATFAETLSGINGNYIINGYDAEIVEGKYVKWKCCLKKHPEYLSIWYPRDTATGTGVSLDAIAWSDTLGLFVITRNLSDPCWSSDGITWTIGDIAEGDDSASFQSVCWSPELAIFCAVASSHFAGTGVITSTDGKTWNRRAEAVTSHWWGVCWSAALTLFCAVGQSHGSADDCVMTSPDGIVWTKRTASADYVWKDVCWSAGLGLFIAVSTSGIMSSANGIAWTDRTPGGFTGAIKVCWSPELGRFLTANVAGEMYTSTNGTDWTLYYTLTDSHLDMMRWSSEKDVFIAGGSSDSTCGVIHTSADGLKWVRGYGMPDSSSYSDIAYSTSLDKFIAICGPTGNNILVSK